MSASLLSIAAADSAWLSTAQDLAYLLAATLFILGLKRLSSPRTARGGNAMAALGMLIAIVATLLVAQVVSLVWVAAALIIGGAIGALLATRVQMTQMPQMVALFNGFGGAASAIVALGELARTKSDDIVSMRPDALFIVGISTLIGGVTFSGSIIAAGKLHGAISGRPITFPAQVPINIILLTGALLLSVGLVVTGGAWWAALLIIALAFALGVTLSIPIGGADMPVMVSLLNSYSGLAAAATGFIIFNKALIVSGALVGASGLILTLIMCKAMNRSILNVLFAGVGTADSTGAAGADSATGVVKSADADDVAIILDSAQQVMIVPGYGLAVAQAQHAVRQLGDLLEARGVRVSYAVHPVAGRMPGHMNVLLAEADVPYDRLLDLDQANPEFERTDATLVIGANDVVNPASRTDTSSPIYGMPILDVDKSRTVFVLKRSMGAGYAGVENALFVGDNTLMVFGDAKQTINRIIEAIKELG